MAVITIGSAATDRAATVDFSSTRVGVGGPADGTGTITSVETYFSVDGTDIRVATFIDEGSNVLSTRDWELLGAVASGSKQTFSGLDMDVASNDYLGMSYTDDLDLGRIEADASGSGWWTKSGEHIPCSSQTFTFTADRTLSLYGAGTTAGVEHEKSLSDAVAIADSIVKEVGMNPADSVALADSFAREVTFKRSLSDAVAIADVISKAVSIPLGDSVAIAEALVKGIELAKADSVAISDSFTRVVEFYRSLTDSVSIADVISKAVSIPLADAVAIADVISKEPGVGLFDAVAIADAIAKGIGVNLDDAMAIADAIVKMRVMVSIRELSPPSRVLDAIRSQLKERQL